MIGVIDKIDFIERYIGLLPDSSIALELHTSVNEIKRLKREFSQLCWNCKNACDESKCDWVRTHIYPRYVELDIGGRIVECDRYAE